MAAAQADPLDSSVRRPSPAPVAHRQRSATQTPSQGIRAAYADFQSWLKGSHGATADHALATFENSTGLNRDQLIYVFAALFVVYMMFGNGAQFLSNLIGFAYPAYASVKALRTDSKEDDTLWLVYWTTFASFFLVDSVGVVLLQYFPVYWILKSLFLIYLYHPQTLGAIYLYENVVDPAVTAFDEWILKKFN